MSWYKELREIDDKYREDVELGHKTLCIDADDYIALFNMAEYSEFLTREKEDNEEYLEIQGMNYRVE